MVPFSFLIIVNNLSSSYKPAILEIKANSYAFTAVYACILYIERQKRERGGGTERERQGKPEVG